ncbi:MAG: hypothetical protein IJZ00_04845 [Lachnospiraceae bacterium]|nr:hypothetical protein [Lachnospiraceae bacterium]
MKIYKKKKRQIAGVMALIIMVSSLLGNAVGMTAYAAEGEYPYMMFASSGDEGAITLTTNNVGINGNVATNGSIVTSSQNVNINGTRTENLGNPEAYIGMPDIGEALEAAYFSANTEVLSEDYSLEDTNININTPLEGEGSIELIGNITLNAGVMAESDLVFSGEVKNTGDVVIYSATGDVVIESTNVNVNGLIYAPHGEIRINSMNLNMNNVILIAEKITIEANGINGGKNQAMAAFIGEDYAVLGDESGDDAGAEDDPSVSGNEGEGEGDDNPSVSENEGNVSDNETELDLTTDTDGDGVPDDVEELVGCDPNKTDSDDDGLTDYEELFVTNTDATNRTSVEAGVTDADADSDGDGISNREEMDAGANPLNTDTDRDGISDYDEKNTYGTGIALPDSDGDGIEDGEELALGLNPLSTNTNGVADNEYLIQQTVSPDSEALEEVNTVENTYRFSLDGMAAGYIENMDIEESGFAGTVANDAISGMVVELEYDMPVQDMTLFFEIKEEYRDNTSGAYVELSEENAGIGRFTVFFWADAVNMLIPIETQYDYENHTVYAETNYLGTYCLMDRELWYEQLGINPEGDSAVMGAMAVLSESGEIVMSEVSSNADATVTDSRTGMTMINGEEKEVYFYNGHMYTIYEGPASWLEAREACENAGGHLATINTADEQAFFEDVILAADVAQRYWIGGYSAIYPYDFEWITGEEFSYTNWREGEPNFLNEYYTEIYGHFNNWYGYWNNHPNVSATRAYICEWESVDYTEDGVLLYCGLTMTALPEDFGVIRQGSTRDYDGDALLDLNEIYVEHELFEGPNESGIYECPTLGEALEYAYGIYGFTMPANLGLNNYTDVLLNTEVVICTSNPTSIDTDGDTIMDGYSEATSTEGYYHFADPNPLFSDIRITTLEQDYISIDYRVAETAGINPSYGGSQTWFDTYNNGEFANQQVFFNNTRTGAELSSYGCGLIAAADVLLYMKLCQEEGAFELSIGDSGETISFDGGFEHIDCDTYFAYVDAMSDYFYLHIVFKGILGELLPGNLETGIAEASEDMELNVDATWAAGRGYSEEENLERIEDWIADNQPVIFCFHNKTGLHLFEHNAQTMTYIEKHNVTAHYMTITGVIEYSDDVEDYVGFSTLLMISSWGETYFIDYNVYGANMDYLTNYMEIN